jgi:RNA polymerase-binding transcription factor DksA
MYLPSGPQMEQRLRARQSEIDAKIAEAEQMAPHKEEALRRRHERHVEALHRLTAQLKAALGKIDDGTYGSCDGCGKSISNDELAHEPAHTLCKSCRRHETDA